MIPVEFRMEKGEDYYAHLRSSRKTMPWLDYLCEHNERLEIVDYYSAAEMQYVVKYRFYLPAAKETYYNLKYR